MKNNNSYRINCDVGEGVGNESVLMPYIDYCNIACGGHAGDALSMAEMVDLAIKHHVLIGAHPSYPDKINFGRKSISISHDKLIQSVRKQIEDLKGVAIEKGSRIHHIKAHGALYNNIGENGDLANIFLEAIKPYKESLKLFVPFGSEIEAKAIEKEFSIIYEAFADRNYNTDLSLVSRSKGNAVIIDVDNMINHVTEIMETGNVTTISNTKVSVKANTFCIHSDTENAVLFAKKLNKLIKN